MHGHSRMRASPNFAFVFSRYLLVWTLLLMLRETNCFYSQSQLLDSNGCTHRR
uniref:Uncharacterized protein n=1 Tax=Arundo donax TaxID=35708 RepID=A0A0A9CBV0_ARUDO